MRSKDAIVKRIMSIACALAVTAAGASIPSHAAYKNAISNNKEGWENLKKENYKKAAICFRNALHENPKYKESLIGLGKAFLEVEAFDQSYDLFSAALAIDSKSQDALIGLGKNLTAMGKYTEAIACFDKTLKLSGQNMEARYGIAYIYTCLGKMIWAKRSLDTILRIDPYHYDSLLLMAEIKSGENRLKEARKYIEKAIDSNNESSKAYVIYGEILLREFHNSEDEDLLDEAKHELANAVSIQPASYQANRILGYIALMEKKYAEAANYFNTAITDLDSTNLLYSLAVAHDRAGDKEAALEEFGKALKKAPGDSMLRNRAEDFLVLHDYKIGNPERVALNKENYALALKREKKNFPDQTLLYLRRTLLLNPMNIEARQLLMDYYNAQGLNQFYIDEMKEILTLTQDRTWQEKLSVAVMKRRDLLYNREGFASEEPPRDVPGVLVLNLDPMGRIGLHPDAGEVIASHLTFVLGQYGRMKPVGVRARTAVTCGLICGNDHLDQSLENVESKIKSGELEKVDYVLYGGYYENGDRITIYCQLLDFKKGFIIGQFTLTESGPESLPLISLRAAKRVYQMVPFSGRVLKMKESGIITNVGLFDGVGTGEKLVIYKFGNEMAIGNRLKKKIILTVKESDTLISYAEPQKITDIDLIDSNDIVLPLKKRRAKRIE